jgi:hypothetical protein
MPGRKTSVYIVVYRNNKELSGLTKRNLKDSIVVAFILLLP